MKKLSCSLLILIFILTALSGCASETKTSSASMAPANERSLDKATEAPPAKSDDGKPMPSQRKVIRNASLDLVAKDVVAAYDELLKFAEKQGGYEIQRDQRKNDGYLYIDAQIRIKPDKLDAFIARAEELTDVINTRIDTEDITDQYYDAQTRLKTMEKSLESYYVYLDKAKTIEESLKVQSQINQLTLEIESLKGSLTLWDKQLAESTITISLRQLDDPVKIRKKINWSTLSLSDTGYLMAAGFKSVVNIITTVLQWLLIAIVACAPIWVAALIIILIIRRRRKRKADKTK